MILLPTKYTLFPTTTLFRSLFWVLAFLYLAPVWAYRYIPTQDGPSHLDNAQVLKELGKSTAGYEAYFEVRAEPIPNWTDRKSTRLNSSNSQISYAVFCLKQ